MAESIIRVIRDFQCDSSIMHGEIELQFFWVPNSEGNGYSLPNCCAQNGSENRIPMQELFENVVESDPQIGILIHRL